MRYFFLVMFLFIELLGAKERVALLIGNSQYQFQPLSNPLNDVRGIKKTLIEIGFKKKSVIVLENASKLQMEEALFDFRKKASVAEIAVVYFSGHGIQVNNTNYLFPANTTATKESDLENLVNLNLFIESANSAKYGVILIDACRTNPLVKYFQNKTYRSSGKKIKKGAKGLGQIDIKQATGEFIIGFATSAGNTADDGIGKNSPYAKALIKNLKEDLEIRKVLGEVGKDVQKKHPHQNPIVKFTLGKEDVCLTGNCGDKISRQIVIKGDVLGDINMNDGDIINGTKVEVHYRLKE